MLPPPRRLCFRRCLSVCQFVCLLATLHKHVRTDVREIFTEGWKWADEQMIKSWWRSVSYRLDTGIVFRIRYYWEIQKLASTNCTARRCSGGHALSGIAIATMTSLRHRPLVEVCTVPVLLVFNKFDYSGHRK